MMKFDKANYAKSLSRLRNHFIFCSFLVAGDICGPSNDDFLLFFYCQVYVKLNQNIMSIADIYISTWLSLLASRAMTNPFPSV